MPHFRKGTKQGLIAFWWAGSISAVFFKKKKLARELWSQIISITKKTKKDHRKEIKNQKEARKKKESVESTLQLSTKQPTTDAAFSADRTRAHSSAPRCFDFSTQLLCNIVDHCGKLKIVSSFTQINKREEGPPERSHDFSAPPLCLYGEQVGRCSWSCNIVHNRSL